MTENEIAKIVVDLCVKIHKALGPGLLESVYEAALIHELRKLGILFKNQIEVPAEYDGIKLDVGFRADLIVGEKVIVELKSVENVTPVFKKQLLTYLRLLHLKLGLLVNFNVELMKQGISRIARPLIQPFAFNPGLLSFAPFASFARDRIAFFIFDSLREISEN